MKQLLKLPTFLNQTQMQVTAFCAITALSILIGIATEMYVLAGIPILLLGAFLVAVDIKTVFFLLLFFIPFSTEIDLPGGLTIDLPDEPLMMALMGVYFLYVLKPSRPLNIAFLRHPITLVLILHLIWIFMTSMASNLFIVSFKFFLAKMWYVTTFFFLAAAMLKKEHDWKVFFWILLAAITITVTYVIVRHAGQGFSFKSINKMVRPFYRNHVNYACLLSLFFPFVWFARHWYEKYSIKWWAIIGGGLIILAGIQFAYTRAAYVALLMAVGAYWVIRWRLVKITLAGISIVIVIGVMWITHNNRYLEFAPNYNKTISHESFDNLLSATSKGTDISTMERVHRWVAGLQMIKENPYMGFGPGNFTRFYKGYTVHYFSTYVSDNEEGSGIHNYYYMTSIEQGIPGMLIFVGLCFLVLLKGEIIYHQTKNLLRQRMVMSVILSFIIMLALLLINDMVEADKLGPFFFINMALLVNLDLLNRKDLKDSTNVQIQNS